MTKNDRSWVECNVREQVSWSCSQQFRSLKKIKPGVNIDHAKASLIDLSYKTAIT